VAVPAKSDGPASRAGQPLLLVIPSDPVVSETFIVAHINRLPARVVPVSGFLPRIDGRPVLSWPERALYRAWRGISRSGTDSATRAYLKVFRQHRPFAVLAEYGVMGVNVMKACETAAIPLIVHFHGFDASMHEVTAQNAKTYPVLFQTAAAVIAVSRPMQRKLVSLGAPPDKVHRAFCGVDCRAFHGGDPAKAPASFITVGRFTAKKAPDLTLRAFAKVHRAHPEAELRMIGDGVMLPDCRKLARDLGVADAVTFLGAQPPAVVQAELGRIASLTTQPIEAPSGDS